MYKEFKKACESVGILGSDIDGGWMDDVIETSNLRMTETKHVW